MRDWNDALETCMLEHATAWAEACRVRPWFTCDSLTLTPITKLKTLNRDVQGSGFKAWSSRFRVVVSRE